MTMLFNQFLRSLFAVTGLFFAALINAHAETMVVDRIYLIVNSQMLTRSEAQDVKSAIMAQNSSAEKTQAELEKQLLMNLMQEMLLLDRANALKIVPMEREIDARLNRLAEDQPHLLEIYSEENLKEQFARDFKKHRVISREVDSRINIDTSDIVNYCDQQLRKDRKIGLAQILLQGSENEIKQQVEKILQEFGNGVSFEDLAKSYSADSSAKRTGGRLGVFKPGDLLKEIGDVTNDLKRGQISEVVETQLGKHLLYIYQEDFPQGLDCQNISETQRTNFSNAIHQQKRTALLDTYMNEMYACAHIEIKDPGSSGLPGALALPEVELENVNCQARRVMVIPQKKKKKKKRNRGDTKS